MSKTIEISHDTFRLLVAALIEGHGETGERHEASLECALWAALDGEHETVLRELAEGLAPTTYPGSE